MAITKERLEELIEQNQCVYFVEKTFNKIYQYKQIITRNQIITFKIVDDKLYIIRKEDEYKPEVIWKIKFENLYETKEEAEFVRKFHTSKTVYFEPPTWEEFLKTKSEHQYCSWDCFEVQIVMYNNNFTVFSSFYDILPIEINYNKNNCKQKYYEAVEYAKNLFLGEEKNEET